MDKKPERRVCKQAKKKYIVVFRRQKTRRRKGDPLGIMEMVDQAVLQLTERR